jgi:hypothetical protein
MVIQKYVNDQYRLSVFGYTALCVERGPASVIRSHLLPFCSDQVMSPFYMCAWLWFVDRYAGLRRVFVSTDDQQQTFGESWRQTWEETKANGCSGFISLFIYRFLSAVRVMACECAVPSGVLLAAR